VSGHGPAPRCAHRPHGPMRTDQWRLLCPPARRRFAPALLWRSDAHSPHGPGPSRGQVRVSQLALRTRGAVAAVVMAAATVVAVVVEGEVMAAVVTANGNLYTPVFAEMMAAVVTAAAAVEGTWTEVGQWGTGRLERRGAAAAPRSPLQLSPLASHLQRFIVRRLHTRLIHPRALQVLALPTRLRPPGSPGPRLGHPPAAAAHQQPTARRPAARRRRSACDTLFSSIRVFLLLAAWPFAAARASAAACAAKSPAHVPLSRRRTCR
jgi:hypothetical protein